MKIRVQYSDIQISTFHPPGGTGICSDHSHIRVTLNVFLIEYVFMSYFTSLVFPAVSLGLGMINYSLRYCYVIIKISESRSVGAMYCL